MTRHKHRHDSSKRPASSGWSGTATASGRGCDVWLSTYFWPQSLQGHCCQLLNSSALCQSAIIKQSWWQHLILMWQSLKYKSNQMRFRAVISFGTHVVRGDQWLNHTHPHTINHLIWSLKIWRRDWPQQLIQRSHLWNHPGSAALFQHFSRLVRVRLQPHQLLRKTLEKGQIWHIWQRRRMFFSTVPSPLTDSCFVAMAARLTEKPRFPLRLCAEKDLKTPNCEFAWACALDWQSAGSCR